MRPERIQLYRDVSEMLSGADFVYIITYKGLTVEKFRQFRGELTKLDANCKVLKNTIIRKVFAEKGVEALANNLSVFKGDTAVIFGNGDASAVAKAIAKFSEANEIVSAKSGYVDGSVLGVADVKMIADLPSKEALQAQLLGVLNAPAQNFVSVLHQACAGIVNVLNAQKNKLEGN